MERKKHGKTTICLRTVGIFDLWTVNHFYSQMYVPYLLNCSLRNSVTAEVFSCSSLTSSKSESAVSQLVHTLFFICLVTTFFLKTQVTSRKCIIKEHVRGPCAEQSKKKLWKWVSIWESYEWLCCQNSLQFHCYGVTFIFHYSLFSMRRKIFFF